MHYECPRYDRFTRMCSQRSKYLRTRSAGLRGRLLSTCTHVGFSVAVRTIFIGLMQEPTDINLKVG